MSLCTHLDCPSLSVNVFHILILSYILRQTEVRSPTFDVPISTSSRDMLFFFFSSRRRHTRLQGDWSSDVCSSDLRPRSGRAAGPDPECADRPGPGRCAPFTSKRYCSCNIHFANSRGEATFVTLREIGRASCRERV